MAGIEYRRPYERGVEDLACSFKQVDAARKRKFVLVYYPNTTSFADFIGTNMVPEQHWDFNHKLRTSLSRWIPGKNGPAHQTRRIQVATCDIPQEDGGAYTIQRVGPLVSTGGYDYWQFGWSDVGSMNRHRKARPEGVMVTSTFSGPVHSSGEVIGHPPIHIHHIHITPAPGVVTKMEFAYCMNGRDPNQCYAANLVIEQHGDYQCKDADGGLDCFFERTADGYAKVLKSQLDIEGEINDVRAPDSEPMTWWYQVVIRWHPVTRSFKALSQQFKVGPGMLNPQDQRHNVLVFPVSTKTESLYWYSGYMGYEGVMARNKLHAHNTMFHSAFYIHGTPEDLGLDDPVFWPQESWRPLPLPEIGYRDIASLRDFLLGNLARAAERWDRGCPFSAAVCTARRPKIICESWVSNEEFPDPASGVVFAYDRRAPCCCRSWHFQASDVFTVVSFMSPMKTPPGPWMPHTIPPRANMHVHWLMTYDALDNESHYKSTVYTQNKERMVVYPAEANQYRAYPIFQMLEAAIFGGMGYSNRQLTMPRRLLISAMWVWVIVSSYPLLLYGWAAFALALCLLGLVHCLLGCQRAKRPADHPAAQCAKHTPCQSVPAVAAAEECVRYAGMVEHDE